MFRSCDPSASSDLEYRLLWHRHLWRKQDPILGLLFSFWANLVFPDVRFCLCIFFHPEHKTDKSGFLSTPRLEDAVFICRYRGF